MTDIRSYMASSAIVAAFLLSGCSSQASLANNSKDYAPLQEANLRSPLLTYPVAPRQPHLAQGVAGRLSLDDGCLYLVSRNIRYLLFFPESVTRWDGLTRTVQFGRQNLPVGVNVEFTGSATLNRSPDAAVQAGPCDGTNVFAVALAPATILPGDSESE